MFVGFKLPIIHFSLYHIQMESLNISFIEHKCFICHKECDGYAHFECCLAYYDEKEKRLKLEEFGVPQKEKRK